MTDAEIDALVPLPQPGINTASHSHLRVVGYPAEQVLAHTRAAVRAALSARLAEPVQTTADVPEANCGKLNAMQEGRDRYTNKASIMAFVEGAWWAAQQLAAPGAAPTVQPVAVPMVGSCQQCGHAHEIPSHLALVPVEPTPEMVRAAEKLDWASPDVQGNCINQWHAMLDAAPKGGA